MTDVSDLAWRKSRRTNPNNNCVEIAPLPNGGMAVRDTKQAGAGPILQQLAPSGLHSSAESRTASSILPPDRPAIRTDVPDAPRPRAKERMRGVAKRWAVWVAQALSAHEGQTSG
jgi:hypothetical protein